MRAFGYTYENGLLKTKADPRGLTFEYAYDDARRIKHIRAGSDTTAYDYDLAGNIRRIEQRSGEDVSVLEHTYNVLGLLEDEVVTLNGSVAQSWHQTWNAAGRRTDLTLRNAPENGEKGSDRTYAYDALGRMTMASNNATGKSTYTHAAHGLSTRRTPWITQAVDEKQTQPSGLVGQINTYVSGQDVLFERLSWRKDHKLAVHILQRKGNVKTQHTYHYDTLGQLEKDIYTYPGLGVTPTYTYGYDPLGVLTNVQVQGNINGNDSWSTDLDALHRISQETLEIEKDAKLLLEGDTEVCVRQVHVSANGGERVEAVLEHIGDHAHWKAYLSHLKLGDSNRIKVTATSEEDVATDHVFEKLLEPYVSSDCDALGNLKSRRNALTGERTDYTWDVWGRLVHVLEHGHDGVMRSWTYRYDALGRRLETTYQGEKTVVIKSFYDPEYEYLELGMSIQSGVACHTIWKQYGPDSSGYYGELNGIGGLEGVINGKTGDSMGAVNDITGNIAAYTYHGQAYFLEGNVDNYGRLSGDEWLTEDSEELEKNTVFWVLKNSRFRGRRVEGNNLSYFGARYYNTETGNFLSPDPYGHDGSLDLYSYASADPVNYVDPDGRLSQPINQPLGSSMPQVQADVPKQGFYQKASSFVTSKLDHIQTFLDVAGMTPGIGNIADIANAAISGSRGNWAEMGLNMAAAVPGIGIGVTAGKLGARAGTEVAHSSMSGLKLNKSIASQAQMSEVGTILAGSGARTPFRDAGRVAEIYGGKATDWVKKTSSSYLARDGMRFESHWVENIKTGQRVEFKTKF
ncbi:MAG: hypothetical protein KDI41_15065 [Pseudomonadales bacterium]|nr:hypothetical protein [Pseudomonadales bacterium]